MSGRFLGAEKRQNTLGSAAEERQKGEPTMDAQQFGKVFGFQPSQDHSVRQTQQLVVDARLGGIAHNAATALRSIENMKRALAKNVAFSDAVLSVAGGMKLLEGEAHNADALLKEAVVIAKAAGFAARGEVEDFEVKRIFGLDSFHRPLTAPETQRVSDTHKALAAALSIACTEEWQAGTQKDIQAHNASLAQVAHWKQRFWEAHALAKSLGIKLSSEHYEDYTPWKGNGAWYFDNKKAYVKKAEAQGLI